MRNSECGWVVFILDAWSFPLLRNLGVSNAYTENRLLKRGVPCCDQRLDCYQKDTGCVFGAQVSTYLMSQVARGAALLTDT